MSECHLGFEQPVTYLPGAAVAYLIAAAIAAPAVERFGRRVMMMVSTGIQFFCFFMLTILLYYSPREGFAGLPKAAEAAIAFFYLYYIGFGLGMLGIPWLYPTEINSLPMRTKGAAVATATDWLTNFIVVEVTPIGIQNLSWKFYIVWTCTNAAFLPVLYFLYPETSDRTLEDLDAYYRDNPPLIVTKDKDAISRTRPEKFNAMHEEDIQRAVRAGSVHSGGPIGGKEIKAMAEAGEVAKHDEVSSEKSAA